MQRTGYANLPLHSGRAPRWLFGRMVKLAGAITTIIVDEFGHEEFLQRIADPFWFQSFGCVLGFDWHSSGVTTTVCGALKESVNKENLGIYVTGGKGKVSRKTPYEIEESPLSTKKIERLKYSSRLSAKVDTSLIQDNYQLYHHCFIFDEKGNWTVVQQGMNENNNYARRYHWLSDNVESFVEEPHEGICCDKKGKNVLDMTANQSKDTRKISVDLVNEKYFERFNKQKTIDDFSGIKTFTMPSRHHIIDMNKRNIETLRKAYEFQPKSYEELIGLRGIGPKSIRSLALISELVYGKRPSWKDPVKYSFAHGGKDNIPYPVNRKGYDKSIEILKTAIDNAKIGDKEKLNAIRRLNKFL